MTIAIAPLLAVANRQISHDVAKWEQCDDAQGYLDACTGLTASFSGMLDTYQSLHRVMVSMYRELANLRTGLDYLSAIPDVRQFYRSQSMTDMIDPQYQSTPTLTEMLIRSDRMAATVDGLARQTDNGSDELITLGHDILSALFQRLTLDDGTVPELTAEPLLDESIARAVRSTDMVNNYLLIDSPISQAGICALTRVHCWSYEHNCPLYTERSVMAHGRNAREWAGVNLVEINEDIYPYLDLYLAKLLSEHNQLHLRLLFMTRYVEIATAATRGYTSLYKAAESYYCPGHTHHAQYLDVLDYILRR